MSKTPAFTVPDNAAVPRSTAQLLKLMARPYRLKTTLFFVLTFLGIMAWTASPVVIAKIINELSREHSVDRFVWILVGVYAALRVIDELMWRIAEYIMLSYKPQMIERIRLTLFTAILKKPYAYFVDSSSGRIGHWINQTVETTNELVDTTLWTVWGHTVGLVISAGFLFTIHWSIALLFVVWLVCLFWFNVHRGKRFGQLVALQSDEASKASGLVVDSVSNHLSVRVFGARRSESRLLAARQEQIVRRWHASWMQNWFTNAVKGQSAAIVSVVALCIVLTLFSRGQVELGSIVLFIAYFGDASSSLWQLAFALDSYYRNFGTIQNALDGLQAVDERQSDQTKKVDRSRSVGLQLTDLTFAYPEQPDLPILNKLNLDIQAGEKLGIVGHSGAGKSTLVGLLLGFYEPSAGTMSLNGESAAKHGPAYIRNHSSFVPQDTNLFNRTVRENVAYAKPDATEAEIIRALKEAQAYDFVQKLPEQLDATIGERGVKLSGGQRQRLAIARAILQDAPLLILDEATSALDSVSEQAIQKALRELMSNRTSIVIAHRLSTLRNLDRIIVLDQGSIAEQGTHEELIAQNGIYADLWKRQKDGFVAS